jgi:hypothetical protein
MRGVVCGPLPCPGRDATFFMPLRRTGTLPKTNVIPGRHQGPRNARPVAANPESGGWSACQIPGPLAKWLAPRNDDDEKRLIRVLDRFVSPQITLAAILTINASSAVLNTNEMMPCAVAVRRMVLSVTPTSDTCAVMPITKEKYTKSQ